MSYNRKYRRAARIDAAQPEIVEKLRAAGCSVQTGVDDIFVGYQGQNYWFEVKTAGAEKTQRNAKDKIRFAKQAELRALWRGQMHVITSFEEAWRIICQNSQ